MFNLSVPLVQLAQENEGGVASPYVQQAVNAVRGSSSLTPSSRFGSLLGQLQGSPSLQTGMLRKLQRGYGNSYVGKVIQTKLTVNQPGDIYEQEADRVADMVMRMPDAEVSGISNGATGIQRTCAACASGQGLCPQCAEEERLQRKPLITPLIQREGEGAANNTPQVTPQIAANIDALRGGGQPLPPSVRAFFEPRFGHDFSQVQVHTDKKAAESARAVDAVAYTIGRDIVFGAGQYTPDTSAGRQLLAHELTHIVQQGRGIRQKLQRTQRVTLRVRGRPPMTVVIGELRFTREAIADVLQHGALLPSADQTHIGFHGDRLGYDPDYTDPTDPFRWSKLRDLIDSDQQILVQKVRIMGHIRVLLITSSERHLLNDLMRQAGLALPTETLHRRIYPNDPTMVASPSPDTHHVFYTTALGSPADSSMAHELFGHMWLAIKDVPFEHPSQPADIAASGTLTAQHGIRDPFGNIYTGTVQGYIDRYVGSERGMLASPTQNVGPQLLQRALTAFKTGFASGATGTLNGPWQAPPDAALQWEIISRNYTLAPLSIAPRPLPVPTSVPSGTQAPPSPTTASPGAAPSTMTSVVPAVTQASIEQDLTAWYGTLNPDKQYVFIRFLEEVQFSGQFRMQPTSQLLGTLSRPRGMAPPPSSLP